MRLPAALSILAFLVAGPSHGDGLSRGRLRCAGSETMTPLLARWADAFARRQPAIELQVESSGSRSAIQALLAGTADIAALSRPPLPAEEASLRRKFGSFRVFRVGTDSLRLLARRGGAAWARPELAPIAFRRHVDGIRPAGRLPGSGTRHEALSMLGLDRPAPGTIGFVSPVALATALRNDPSFVGYGSTTPLLSEIAPLPGPVLERPLLILTPGRNPSSTAGIFLDFVGSPEGRGIVAGSGLVPVGASP